VLDGVVVKLDANEAPASASLCEKDCSDAPLSLLIKCRMSPHPSGSTAPAGASSLVRTTSSLTRSSPVFPRTAGDGVAFARGLASRENIVRGLNDATYHGIIGGEFYLVAGRKPGDHA
jgi:hypothetical protein